MNSIVSLACAIALAQVDTLHAQQARDSGSTGEVLADPAWDAIFTREAGWNGGDIAHSIDLRDGRTLWFFGDSIIGPVRDGARRGEESKFVRGAIGWHPTPKHGETPLGIEFAGADALGDTPAAQWAKPDAGLFPEGSWFWLMNDGEVVTDPSGERRLVCFATVLGSAGNPDGVWDFRQIGGAILTTRELAGSPAAWRPTQTINPLVTAEARFGEAHTPTDNWGLAIIDWPAKSSEGERTLFVYGVRAERGANGLLIARCAEEHLDSPDAWRFFDGSAWSTDPHDASVIAQGLVSEFTVEAVAIPGRAQDTLVLVQSEPMLGRRILVRTAGSPEGPWSGATPVFEVPELANDDRLMTYAAKGHAGLSRGGELLVSYVINSRDFGQIFADAKLYRPRFVRIPASRIPHAPD